MFALQFQIRVSIDAAFLCAAVALPEDESDLEVEACLQSRESRSNSQSHVLSLDEARANCMRFVQGQMQR